MVSQYNQFKTQNKSLKCVTNGKCCTFMEILTILPTFKALKWATILMWASGLRVLRMWALGACRCLYNSGYRYPCKMINPGSCGPEAHRLQAVHLCNGEGCHLFMAKWSDEDNICWSASMNDNGCWLMFEKSIKRIIQILNLIVKNVSLACVYVELLTMILFVWKCNIVHILSNLIIIIFIRMANWETQALIMIIKS
jgi:hypothetical protein